MYTSYKQYWRRGEIVQNIIKNESNNEEQMQNVDTMTRRQALRLLSTCALGTAFLPKIAKADTASDLSAKKADYKKAKQELEKRSIEVANANKEVAKVQEEIYKIDDKINKLEKDIKEQERLLAEKQDVLGKRISQDYKSGNNNILSLIFSATSIEELTSNVYYFSKISQQDQVLIKEVQNKKSELKDSKDSLSKEKKSLEKQRAEKDQKVKEAQNKEESARKYVNSLNKDVKKLLDRKSVV